jgi:hypothetical protein
MVTMLPTLNEMAETCVSPQWLNHDGGWLRHLLQTGQKPGQSHHSDARTSALALLFLLEHDSEAYQKVILEGIKFLMHTQHLPAGNIARETEGGGWGLNDGHTIETTTTGLSLFAEITYTTRSQRWENSVDCLSSMEYAREWLTNHHRLNGGWSDFAHHASSASATCWVGLALRGCLGIEALEKPAIKTLLGEALERVAAAQYKGGWNETLSRTRLAPHIRSTAQCVYLACKLEERGMAEEAIGWLKEQQTPREGCWPAGLMESPIETAAWAILALLASGMKPADSIIEHGVAYLLKYYMKEPNGWPEKPGGQVERETSLYVCLALAAYHRANPL